MSNTTGKLIVIEGIDGSGKTTQTKLLVKHLHDEHYPVEEISFPRYGEPSAENIEKYLRGEFGPQDSIPAKQICSYFAEDRSAAAPQIRQWLDEGRIVVSNRYASSNAGHQSIRYTDPKQLDEFLKWWYNYEYHELGIPEPDITVVLELPYALAQQHILKKNPRAYINGEKMDIHEKDLSHLERAAHTYALLAERYPTWHLIPVASDGIMKPKQEIHAQIWGIVKSYLPKSP